MTVDFGGHSGMCFGTGGLASPSRARPEEATRSELSPGRRQHPIADISRITAHTGWEPRVPIEETLKIGREDIDNVTGTPVVTVRERVHSLVELREILGYAAPDGQPEHRYVLVIAIGDRRFCVAVDELLGQEEVVIKAVEGIDTETTGILGATITGDGRIVLIIDPSSMAKLVAGISAV